jgi:hypothetical protein
VEQLFSGRESSQSLPGPIHAGVSELASGYGPAAASAPGGGAAAAVTELTRLLRRARRGLDPTRLRALLGELRGCLTMLPSRSQKVLLLRSGLIGSHPLSVRRIAVLLHLSAHRVIAEEIAGLRKLRTAMQSSSCAMTEAPHAFTLTSYAGFPGAAYFGNRGVADAFYLRAATPTKEAPRLPGVGAGTPAGITPVNAGSSVLVFLIIAAGGVVLVGLLAADSLGVNPLRRPLRRHRRR